MGKDCERCVRARVCVCVCACARVRACVPVFGGYLIAKLWFVGITCSTPVSSIPFHKRDIPQNKADLPSKQEGGQKARRSLFGAPFINNGRKRGRCSSRRASSRARKP